MVISHTQTIFYWCWFHLFIVTSNCVTISIAFYHNVLHISQVTYLAYIVVFNEQTFYLLNSRYPQELRPLSLKTCRMSCVYTLIRYQ